MGNIELWRTLGVSQVHEKQIYYKPILLHCSAKLNLLIQFHTRCPFLELWMEMHNNMQTKLNSVVHNNLCPRLLYYYRKVIAVSIQFWLLCHCEP